MNTRIPVRRLGKSALAASRLRSTYWITTRAPCRSFCATTQLKKNEPETKDADPLANPILEKYLQKHDPSKQPAAPKSHTGRLSSTSIFKPDYEMRGYREGMHGRDMKALKESNKRKEEQIAAKREHDLHALTLDPAPELRRRFERKMVIRDLSKHGRVSKAVKLARTERQSLYRSPDLPTSTKKMMRIMHLIAGKTVEEALLQLRFSKKRIARDVLKGLQLARDEAIAARGMGLGPSSSPLPTPQHEISKESGEIAKSKAPYLADGSYRRPKGTGKEIELKDGSKKTVWDTTEMYVDQAWVGRGESWKSLEFRARGRTNLLTHRTTSFSVLLKEEKTRMRISDEIQKKRENRKLWVGLPDKPVTQQSQYCLW